MCSSDLVHQRTEFPPRLAKRLGAPETAQQIHRSVETVRFHLKKAMATLGARTIAQAVTRAALAGLIDPAAENE